MKRSRKDFRIGIVGGGPAGAWCAYLLTRAGFSVTLMERGAKVKRKVCGEYLAPAATHLFEQAGIPDFLSGRFPTLSGIDFHLPGNMRVPADFPEIAGRPCLGYALDRVVLEEDLLNLGRRNGADIRMACAVRSLERAEQGWKLRLETGDTESFDLVVGADGRHSLVAKSLGVHRDVRKPRVALHCFLPGKLPEPGRGRMYFFEDGAYIGLNASPAGNVNLSLVYDLPTLKKLGDPRQALAQYLDKSEELSGLMRLEKNTPVYSTYPVNHSVIRCHGPDAALVGDAAGIIDPLTGEGIYLALWSANCLADQLQKIDDLNSGQVATALRNYARVKEETFRWKNRVSLFFQWAIKNPRMIRLIAAFMKKKQARSSAFIGMMGHLYPPPLGLKKILWSS